MPDPDRSRTRMLATALAEERANAESHLWREMFKRGLHKADGWRIVEFTRDADGGTEIVLRPLHLYLASPPGLECIVGLVGADGEVHSRCEPGDPR